MREAWRKALAEGDLPGRSMRAFFRLFPASPRCGICLAPFHGIGSILLKPLPFTTPSRKNPNWCKVCFEASPVGGAEVPAGILFADIRGYTAYSESRAPRDVAAHLNRFYKVAADAFSKRDAIIDKLVGDEVMAFWVPGFAGKNYIEKMIDASEAVLRAVGFGSEEQPWLPLGLGLDMGNAFVGNVGHGEVKDFTALGDVVNTAARLQGQAKPGQIVMSERVYEHARDRYPGAPRVELDLKGKSELVAARIIELSTPVAA